MDSHQGSDAVIREFPESPRQTSLRGMWRGWAAVLRRRQLDGLACWLLEAGRPLALVSAQLLHMGRPLLGPGAGHLAELLESDDETADFMEYLGRSLDENSNMMQGGS